ncbi:MAG: hypothetical protein J6U07_02385 [Fibrobacter sp.]|nr:hypothetical protein [Fibrobacter sp.]
MPFYSETYHDSTQYAPRSSGDPVMLHWENMPLLDKRYAGAKRYALSESKCPLHAPAFADGLCSVGVYLVVRGGEVPDGVYFYDQDSRELVNIGGRPMMAAIAAVFPEKNFVEQANILYLYTGLMERSVWRFRESAYRQVQMDVGAACANTILFAKSQGKKVFPLAGFVDDALAVALELGPTELPLAAVALFPENSMVAFNSVDDGMGEFAYSNRSENMEPGPRYPSRFMLQNRGECINDLDRCIKVRRVVTKPLSGEEFPLTPAKYPGDFFFHEIWFLKSPERRAVPFDRATMDIDDFSSMLRWLEAGPINAFGAGLLKIWVVVFDVMFVFSGAYRYVPVRKSIYMQRHDANVKKFAKCFADPEAVQNASFAVILTSNLEESCGILGERAYRYLNLNAGFLQESLDLSGRLLHKNVRTEHFVFQDDLRKVSGIPESEQVISCSLVGKNLRLQSASR